jgi:hypothetical protein
MANLDNFVCPSCGAKYDLLEGTERIICPNCGNEHFVNRSIENVSLNPANGTGSPEETVTEKKTTELEIDRIQEEIKQLEIKKQNLTGRYSPNPPPSRITCNQAIWLLMFPMAFIMGTTVSGTYRTMAFILGIIGLLAGTIPLFTYKRRKEAWQGKMSSDLKEIDETIIEKQDELQKYQI